jgi:hypothetical protein
VLDQANDLLATINEMVDSGELDRRIGKILDERIQKIVDEINEALEQNGGRVFDRLDGTIERAFDNLSALLDQINKDVLAPGGSVPAIIDQISEALLLETNLLGGQLEDIVALSVGGALVFVDKAVNGTIVIVSLVLLGVGAIVFVSLLAKGKVRPRGRGIAWLVLMGLYVAFFLVVALVSPVRGWIMAGLDLGKEASLLDLPPKVRGVVPQGFELGSDPRIVVFGNHLDKIGDLNVYLYQGTERVFTFPKKTHVVATRNRIVLGNFGSALKWRLPRFKPFEQDALRRAGVSKATYQEFIGKGMTLLGRASPGLRPTVRGARMTRKEAMAGLRDLARAVPAGPSAKLADEIDRFFHERYKLSPGDYGVHVFDGETRVDSPVFITVSNPPPPPPKPDIRVIDADWYGGVPPVKGLPAQLAVRLRLTGAQEITEKFAVRIRSPQLRPQWGDDREEIVALGDIALAAATDGLIDIVSPSFTVAQSGAHQFDILADSKNEIDESNEGNNAFTSTLVAPDYVYDVTVALVALETKGSGGSAENRFVLDGKVTAGQHGVWSVTVEKEGARGETFPIADTARTFVGLRPGGTILIQTNCTASPVVLPLIRHRLGAGLHRETLDTDPTGGQDREQRPITVSAKHYSLKVVLTIVRRAL